MSDAPRTSVNALRLRPRDYAALAAIGAGLWLATLTPTSLLIILIGLSILVGRFLNRAFIG